MNRLLPYLLLSFAAPFFTACAKDASAPADQTQAAAFAPMLPWKIVALLVSVGVGMFFSGRGDEDSGTSKPKARTRDSRAAIRTWVSGFAVLLLSALAALLFVRCAKDAPVPAPPMPVERTLLVYMAGDNNLASNGYDNLQSITAAMQGYAGDARTVIYLDTPDQNPRLIDVTPLGQTELYRWPSPQNSASAATLTEVIALTRELAPASHYGLILWSHGVAWLPASAQGYLTRTMSREPDPWPATKWFGQDVTASPVGYLDTEELAAAIPDNLFDYILFDACYMASVEVEYALRNKTNYIIAAPTEVISTGFPYGAIVRNLLQPTPDLEAVCQSYYNFYADHPDPSYRSATVSLVKTAELDALATATADLYAEALAADPEVFSAFDLSTLQPFDRYRRHFLFDMGSIVDELTRQGKVSLVSLAAWRAQLAQTVVCEAHTPAFFDMPIVSCCGLSSFVPVAAYADLKDYYAALDWSVAINNK